MYLMYFWSGCTLDLVLDVALDVILDLSLHVDPYMG